MVATTYIRHSLFIGVLLLVLSACGQAVAMQATAPGAVPAGLERFYTQELTFGPCADYAITDGRKLTDLEAVVGVLFALNIEEIWPGLIQAIADLIAGRATP